MKIIDIKDITKDKIQKELDKRLITATVDDVLQIKPRFSLTSEIFYNDSSKEHEDNSLPKILYGKRKIHWETLGTEIMAYEGFIIEINIYDPSLYELNRKFVIKK